MRWALPSSSRGPGGAGQKRFEQPPFGGCGGRRAGRCLLQAIRESDVAYASFLGMLASPGFLLVHAIALAAARLHTAEETLAKQLIEKGDKEYDIKSKVIILLTDGENNRGNRTPLQAAELAKEWGIKIYAIGVGGGESDGDNSAVRR